MTPNPSIWAGFLSHPPLGHPGGFFAACKLLRIGFQLGFSISHGIVRIIGHLVWYDGLVPG